MITCLGEIPPRPALETHVDGSKVMVINSPLADCAYWAVRNLAEMFRQPCTDSSEIIDQIGLAARALRAYQKEVDGSVPADFLPRAMGSATVESPLDASTEQLLISVAVVAAADQNDDCPANRNTLSSKLGDWLAGACLRTSKSWAL